MQFLFRVIKLGKNGDGSTNIVGSFDQKAQRLTPVVTHEKLRGSSISSIGSSSSSTSSQMSDDDSVKEGNSFLGPPCLPRLERLPALKGSNIDPSAHSTLNSFHTFKREKLPPKLESIHITPPPLPTPAKLISSEDATQVSAPNTKSKF